MAKSKDRFIHGEHNEQACDLIAANNNFPDWVITTAFHTALHFVTYKIFPFTYKVGGNSLNFDTIEQWQSFKNYSSNKRHELLKDLVAVHCQAIHSEYDWLKSKKIKKACQPPKE